MTHLDVYETLLVAKMPKGLMVTFNRPAQKNAIDAAFLRELNRVLDMAQADDEVNFLLLRGSGGFFCTGLDFQAFSNSLEGGDRAATETYMALLKRIAGIPRIVIAMVEGKVMAGGVGIAAACDLLYATPESEFVLSEALWGLLPSCVTPFLIRRVGYQRAYRMTLTTTGIDGNRAYQWGLVDELAEKVEPAARRALPRLARLDPTTVGDMKRFFRKMWLMNEDMEAAAVAETERLLSQPRIQKNIDDFVRHGKLPWQ